jgi:hypothetical protein
MKLYIQILLFLLPATSIAQQPCRLQDNFVVNFGGKAGGSYMRDVAVSVDSLELFVRPDFTAKNARILRFTVSAGWGGLDLCVTNKSNHFTKEQKNVFSRSPVFNKVYIEEIYIAFNDTVINWGALAIKIDGYSCSLFRKPSAGLEWIDKGLMYRFSYITRNELLANNEIAIQEPNCNGSNIYTDTSLIITGYSCNITWHIQDIFENEEGVLEEDYIDYIDTTFIISGRAIPVHLKNLFSDLCETDKVRFYHINAQNIEGRSVEVAPLDLEITE